MEPRPKRAKHDHLHCPVQQEQQHEQQQQEEDHHDTMITVDILDRPPHTSQHDSSSCFADGNIISTAALPRNTSPPKIVDSKTSTSTHHQKKLVVLLQQEEQESSRTRTRRTAPDVDLEEEQEAKRNITTSSAALLLLARQKEEKHCEIKNKQRQLLVVRNNHDQDEQQEMMKDRSLKPAPLKIPAGSNNCDENMRVLVPQDEQYDGGQVHNDKKQEHVLQELSPREVSSTKTNSNNEDEKQSSITMNSEPNDDNKVENVVSSSITMQDSIQTKESFSSDDSIENNIFQDGPKKFPIKLMAVLSSSKHTSIISWTDGGTSFTIHQPKEFVAHILPKFFRKSSKFHSFIRKLYRWGFAKKMDTKHKPNQHSRGAGEEADSKTYFHPVRVPPNDAVIVCSCCYC
mmetsp:Transcript_7951/g.14976  ORF Transcript_7951/g.14976 Transcript_7951/m.14976 type:complete len:402 (-) Transcript_7951:1150-2355(-)